MRLLLWMFAVLLPLTAFAQQQMPTDIDLKTAYCLPFAREELSVVKVLQSQNEASFGNDPQKLAEMRELSRAAEKVSADNVDRLTGYLMSKAGYVDSRGIETAIRRGESDAKERGRIIESCSATCNLNGPHADAKAVADAIACFQGCGQDNPVMARYKSCYPINWLPY